MKITSLKPLQKITNQDLLAIENDAIEDIGNNITRITDLHTATALLKNTEDGFEVIDNVVYADISTVVNTRELCEGTNEDRKIPLNEIEIGDVFTDQCSTPETSITVVGDHIVLFTDLTRNRAIVAFDLGNGWEIAARTIELPAKS